MTTEYLTDEKRGEESAPDAVDEAFFRKYRRMPDDTKRKIRQMIDLWSERK